MAAMLVHRDDVDRTGVADDGPLEWLPVRIDQLDPPNREDLPPEHLLLGDPSETG